MSSPLVVLDTSVVLHLYRGKSTGVALHAAVETMLAGERPVLSAVTVGEALAFAARRGWGTNNTQKLRDQLARCVVVGLDGDLFDRYADIDAWTKKQGRSLSDNDVWIAATAAMLNATLVTTDKDFAALAPAKIQVALFDSAGQPLR